MAEAVVDGLEVIHIQEDQVDRHAVPVIAQAHGLVLLDQQAPVAEPGEGVLVGQFDGPQPVAVEVQQALRHCQGQQQRLDEARHLGEGACQRGRHPGGAAGQQYQRKAAAVDDPADREPQHLVDAAPPGLPGGCGQQGQKGEHHHPEIHQIRVHPQQAGGHTGGDQPLGEGEQPMDHRHELSGAEKRLGEGQSRKGKEQQGEGQGVVVQPGAVGPQILLHEAVDDRPHQRPAGQEQAVVEEAGVPEGEGEQQGHQDQGGHHPVVGAEQQVLPCQTAVEVAALPQHQVGVDAVAGLLRQAHIDVGVTARRGSVDERQLAKRQWPRGGGVAGRELGARPGPGSVADVHCHPVEAGGEGV